MIFIIYLFLIFIKERQFSQLIFPFAVRLQTEEQRLLSYKKKVKKTTLK